MSRKRLVVMRHAKSDWDSDAKTDHDRPLNHRGTREAHKVGELLRDQELIPGLVISSDSRRTTETWERIADALSHPPVRFESTLYLAGIEGIRDVARKHIGELSTVTTLLVLGHNPGWEDSVRVLSGRRIDLKTAHAAVLRAKSQDADWLELLADGPGFELVEVLKPSEP